MADGTYNGWANYETWLVNLWLTNDQATFEYAKEFLAGRNEGRLDQPDDGSADDYDAANIKEFVEDILLEDRPEGMMADLVNAALGSVIWIEIARSLLEE